MVTAGSNQLTGTCLFSTVSSTPTVSTNMSQYQNYAIERVIDGNPNSYFWSSTSQTEGDYILLTYAHLAASIRDYHYLYR